MRRGGREPAPLPNQVKRFEKKSFTRWVKDGSLFAGAVCVSDATPGSRVAEAFEGPAAFGSSTPVASAAGGVSLPVWTGAGCMIWDALIAR